MNKKQLTPEQAENKKKQYAFHQQKQKISKNDYKIYEKGMVFPYYGLCDS